MRLDTARPTDGRSRSSAVTRGLRDASPIAASMAPFGTIVGVSLDAAGASGASAVAATAFVYSGAAQLACLSMLVAGGGLVGAVLAGAVVNLRLVRYSASHGPRFRAGHPWWFRWLAPVLTTDVLFAMAAAADDLAGSEFRRYWITVGGLIGVVWVAAASLGMRLGAVVPGPSPLRAVVPATFVALLVPQLSTRRLRRVALVATVVALVTHGLPSGLGTATAIAAGLAVADRPTEGGS